MIRSVSPILKKTNFAKWELTTEYDKVIKTIGRSRKVITHNF